MFLVARGAFDHRSIACAEQADFVAIRLAVAVPVKERDVGATAVRPMETITDAARIFDADRVMQGRLCINMTEILGPGSCIRRVA